MSPNRVRVLFAAGILAAGCGGDSTEGLVVDTPPVDTVRMQLAWNVSEGTHATADSLGDLSGIAVDGAGNMYVSDRVAIKTWVFDSAGRSLDAIGRRGEGPGEFDTPAAIAIGPDFQLYVRDLRYVGVFAMDSSTGRLSRFVRRFDGSPFGDWQRAGQ